MYHTWPEMSIVLIPSWGQPYKGMQKDLQIYLPFPKSLITQRFDVNANVSYARDGLKGHTAYDWGAEYGTPVPNCAPEAYCYSLLNKDNPDLMKYRAVFTLVETKNGIYEVSYGHFDHILAEVGKTYSVGEILGTVGNSGTVFSGDHEVTAQEKNEGSKAGAHLHGPQVRPVKKVTKTLKNKQYLSTGKGLLKRDGYFLEVINYKNGFNGCVSLAPFSTEKLATKKKTVAEERAEQLTKFADKIEAEIPSIPEPTRKLTQTALVRLREAIKGLLRGDTLY